MSSSLLLVPTYPSMRRRAGKSSSDATHTNIPRSWARINTKDASLLTQSTTKVLESLGSVILRQLQLSAHPGSQLRIFDFTLYVNIPQRSLHSLSARETEPSTEPNSLYLISYTYIILYVLSPSYSPPSRCTFHTGLYGSNLALQPRHCFHLA